MREPWLILLCSAKTMKKLLLALCAANLAWFALEAAQPVSNASHIDVYVTPYYNSKGPSVSIGRFSSGLASGKEDEFLATIGRMKKDWNQLTFPELYVAAIRLYDLGYRKEAVYWFYSAQYRGRQFVVLLDQSKMGSIGSAGFELFQARMPSFNWWGLTSMVTPSEIRMRWRKW